jgi:uncharacterized protein (DUF362 family)
MMARGDDWVSICPLKTLCLPQVSVEQQKNNYKKIYSSLNALLPTERCSPNVVTCGKQRVFTPNTDTSSPPESLEPSLKRTR